MSKLLLFILSIILGINFSVAGYHCNSANDCVVYCSNVEHHQVNSLKNTDWITVPWDDGSCYFHNTLTKENSDTYPLVKIQ